MPTATEDSAPKAAAKPKAPAKKPAAPAGDAKKPAAEKKPAAPGSEKKPAAPGSEKKPAASGDKKPADKKPADKKPADKKPADKKPADKKPADKKPADKKPADKKPASSDSKPADKKPARKIEEVVDETPAVPVYLPKLPATLAVLNTLEWASCAKVFGHLLNFTPSLGAALAQLRPYRTTQHLVDLLNQALDALPAPYIAVFLKRFNELALIPKDKLNKEHKCCVGLEALTEDQKKELTPLYAQYREKFGFPYVVCAREAKASELSAKLKAAMQHQKDQEVEAGRKEVKKIARLRLLEVVVA